MDLYSNIIDETGLDKALTEGQDALPLFRNAVKQANETLGTLFRQGQPIKALVELRARLIDGLLIRTWRLKIPKNTDAALIAVGGYGRGELHPASDIDIMVLLGPQKQHAAVPPPRKPGYVV